MNLGQIYTKPIVADYMVSLFDLSHGSRILDPCFGDGVFVEALLSKRQYNIDAIELDTNSFHSYKPSEFLNLKLFCGNFFDHRATDYDGIIMNPPYVRQEEIDLMQSLGITKQSLQKKIKKFRIPQKANLYVYFILYAIELLKNNGQMIVIFPSSWINSTLANFIKQAFASYGYISNFIYVSGNPFESKPLVKVCIIKFIKGVKGTTSISTLLVTDNNVETVKSEYTHFSLRTEYTTSLSNICSIKRGLTTFFNQMFINPIIHDESFLIPIVSSPKSLKGYSTKGAKLDNLLYITSRIPLSKEVIEYLDAFKNQIIRKKRPVTLYERIMSNEKWFMFSNQKSGNIIFPYIIRNQPFFVLNTDNLIARDNFYNIYCNCDNTLLFGLLNNYYVYAQLEEKGKNYGNGLLKIQKYDVDSILIVNPSSIPSDIKNHIIELSEALLKTNNCFYISKITELLSPFYCFSQIEEFYNLQKTKRLGK